MSQLEFLEQITLESGIVTGLVFRALQSTDMPPGFGVPGGLDTQVQFNDGAAFGGVPWLIYSPTFNIVVAGISSNVPGPALSYFSAGGAGVSKVIIDCDSSIIYADSGGGFFQVNSRVDPTTKYSFTELALSLINSNYTIERMLFEVGAEGVVQDNGTLTSFDFYVLNDQTGVHNIFIDGATGHIRLGGSGFDPSALLDVPSITAGLLPPRMTTAQKNAIASPTEGLRVYDATEHAESVQIAAPGSPLWALLGYRNLQGTFAAKPAPGLKGRMYSCTDINMLLFDNGSAWVPIGPTLSILTLPLSGSLTQWLNQGGAVADFSTGVLEFTINGAGVGVNSIHALLMDAPTPPYSLFVQLSCNLPIAPSGALNAECGIVMSDGTAGLLWGPSWRLASGPSLEYQAFSDPNTVSDGPFTNTPAPWSGGFPWIYVQDTGSLRVIGYGNPDGNRFTPIFSEGRTVGFTASKIGIGFNPCGPTGFQCSATFYSYAITQP